MENAWLGLEVDEVFIHHSQGNMMTAAEAGGRHVVTGEGLSPPVPGRERGEREGRVPLASANVECFPNLGANLQALPLLVRVVGVGVGVGKLLSGFLL